jgi:rare lipoprotein A
VTKRRPSWSDRLLRVVAIGGGLLLLHGPLRAAADDTAPAATFGTAAMLDADTVGLHGHASFYGQGFKGRRTATGERFDPRQFTAASNRFPLGSRLAVLRPDNGRCAVVRVNDRMHTKHRRRIVDVARGVAEHLGMLRAGVVVVRVAPLPEGWSGRGETACRAVFAAAPECPDCPADDSQPD